jgi:hypothetical protein
MGLPAPSSIADQEPLETSCQTPPTAQGERLSADRLLDHCADIPVMVG